MNSTVETQSDLTKLRIRVAELRGYIFQERPEWNDDHAGIIWRLYFNHPPEGDWEDNSLMVGLAGEVRRVSHDKAMERIASGEKWHNCSPDYPSDLNACKRLIDLLAEKGWTCRLDNGLDKTWECTFRREEGSCRLCNKGFPRNDQYWQHYGTQSLGMIPNTTCDNKVVEHYEPADNLAEAICRAFVAVMEGRSVQGGNEKL